MRSPAGLVALALATAATAAALVGCSGTTEQNSPTPRNLLTPQATLDTFFRSAQRQDYHTTYSCYYQRYQDLVSEQEFVSRRASASTLSAYRVDSLAVEGDSAVATITLSFVPAGRIQGAPRTIQTQERLVRQSGAWKIQVW